MNPRHPVEGGCGGLTQAGCGHFMDTCLLRQYPCQMRLTLFFHRMISETITCILVENAQSGLFFSLFSWCNFLNRVRNCGILPKTNTVVVRSLVENSISFSFFTKSDVGPIYNICLISSR